MIKRLTVSNFKSLLHTEAELDQLTVLVGRSGTGKSNFIAALRVLCLLVNQQDGLTSFSETGLQLIGPVQSAGTDVNTSWQIEFDDSKSDGNYKYCLTVKVDKNRAISRIIGEELRLADNIIFKWENGNWLVPTKGQRVDRPDGSRSLLRDLANRASEIRSAFEIISSGISCYRWSDDVLAPSRTHRQSMGGGMAYDGFGALTLVEGIKANPIMPKIWKKIVDSMKSVMPNPGAVAELFESGFIMGPGGKPANGTTIPLAEWSEGFRRLLAAFIAIYQNPPKMTICLEEPETGLSYRAQMILAENLLSAAEKVGTQFIITTQSPQFLDRFPPPSIRLVEIGDNGTLVRPPHTDDILALRDKLMMPGELLAY